MVLADSSTQSNNSRSVHFECCAIHQENICSYINYKARVLLVVLVETLSNEAIGESGAEDINIIDGGPVENTARVINCESKVSDNRRRCSYLPFLNVLLVMQLYDLRLEKCLEFLLGCFGDVYVPLLLEVRVNLLLAEAPYFVVSKAFDEILFNSP